MKWVGWLLLHELSSSHHKYCGTAGLLSLCGNIGMGKAVAVVLIHLARFYMHRAENFDRKLPHPS